LRSNVYLTTSGHFWTRSLQAAIAEIGVDRVLFSVDYPFEETVDAATWIDTIALPDADRAKIARFNAMKLFGMPV
jgi:predicted TIM-barrel fold metal-dependent hydrolase